MHKQDSYCLHGSFLSTTQAGRHDQFELLLRTQSSVSQQSTIVWSGPLPCTMMLVGLVVQDDGISAQARAVYRHMPHMANSHLRDTTHPRPKCTWVAPRRQKVRKGSAGSGTGKSVRGSGGRRQRLITHRAGLRCQQGSSGPPEQWLKTTPLAVAAAAAAANDRATFRCLSKRRSCGTTVSCCKVPPASTLQSQWCRGGSSDGGRNSAAQLDCHSCCTRKQGGTVPGDDSQPAVSDAHLGAQHTRGMLQRQGSTALPCCLHSPGHAWPSTHLQGRCSARPVIISPLTSSTLNPAISWCVALLERLKANWPSQRTSREARLRCSTASVRLKSASLYRKDPLQPPVSSSLCHQAGPAGGGLVDEQKHSGGTERAQSDTAPPAHWSWRT